MTDPTPIHRYGVLFVVLSVLLVGATTVPAAAQPSTVGNAAATRNATTTVHNATTTQNVTTGDRLLVVQNATSGDRLLAVPVSNGSNVTLAYTHSVEKSRVLDVYRIAGDRLVNTRMVFADYGAGLPANQPVDRTASGAFVFDPDWSGTELYVKPGPVAGHVLFVDGRRFDLVAISNASTVRISVANRSANATASR